MRFFIFGIVLLLPVFALSQDNDTTISLNILNAPSSPAFNLLGIAPSAIERPTDLNSFRISIQNATNNFSRLPSDYSVEVAPASLARMNNQTLDKFGNTSFHDVFWQSLSVSLGLTHGNAQDIETDDSTSFAKLGFGIKFSIIRPAWSQRTKKLFTELEDAQIDFLTSVDSQKNPDVEHVRGMIANVYKNGNLGPQAKRDSVKLLMAQLKTLNEHQADTVNKELADLNSKRFLALRTAAQNFKVERKGAFLDFASGIALDFPGNSFNFSRTNKAGAWLTGGYEGGNNGFSFLGIARYLFQPDLLYAGDSGQLKTADIATFDLGARLIFTGMDGKFAMSAEALYRSSLSANTINPDWRYTFNTEYDIGLNKKITLALGKNFDGSITKNGNIIAMLNLIAGFGSSKKIHSG